MFSMDSWLWRIAVVGAIVLMREFVRLLTAPVAASAMSAAPPDTTPSVATPNVATSSLISSSVAAQSDERVRGLLEILDATAIAFGLVFFIIQPWLVQAFYIPSGSMEDTLRYQPTGDRLLVAKWIYRVRAPRFGDVVVFVPPPQARAQRGDEYIKRCIGEPGDVIVAQNRRYFRRARGEKKFVPLQEPYVKWSVASPLYGYDLKIVGGKVYSREYSNRESPGFWQREGEVGRDQPPFENQGQIEAAMSEPIPEDKYLVLGDHRNNSNDSHAWGLVPRAAFIGKAMCVFWPPDRVGTLDRMSEHPRAPQPVDSSGALPLRQ